MKKKRILIVSAIVLLFLTVASAVTVFSADGDTTTQPKVEKAGGVELKVKRFPISRYQANNEASDDLIKGAFVGLTNVTFSLRETLSVWLIRGWIFCITCNRLTSSQILLQTSLKQFIKH